MWGWTINRKSAFALLDEFYTQGFRQIDAATNYPINKVPADFRRSEQILEEWIKANGIHDLSIMMKVGSISNMRTPDHNLKASFLLLNWQQYAARLGLNLGTMMIHWDNRAVEEEIQDSLNALKTIAESGMAIGLSGIKNPQIYAHLLPLEERALKIQIKHNLLYSDYPRYSDFHGKAAFYTYGINAGGMKIHKDHYHQQSSLKVRGGNTEQLHPAVEEVKSVFTQINSLQKWPNLSKMNEAAMNFAYYSSDIKGILIGPSRLEQLKDSIQFFKQLEEMDYALFYQKLLKIHRTYAPEDRKI